MIHTHNAAGLKIIEYIGNPSRAEIIYFKGTVFGDTSIESDKYNMIWKKNGIDYLAQSRKDINAIETPAHRTNRRQLEITFQEA